MEFLNPTAFWGMIALLLPIIVLLLSKKKQDEIKFPSLKFLEESESKSARSIFPTEWLLWLLRIAAISLLVFMLARPIFSSGSQSKNVYIEKEVFEDESFATVLSSLDGELEQITSNSLWLLAAQLNASKDSAIVYTRNNAKDFKGRSVQLGSHVEWKIVPSQEASKYLDTVTVNNQANEIKIESGENGLKWTSQKIEAKVELPEKPIKIKLVSSTKSQKDTKLLSSMLQSYSTVLPLNFELEAENSDWLVTIDTFLASVGEKTIQWDFLEGPLRLDVISSDDIVMKGELSSENLEKSDFALELAHIFLSDKLDLERLDRRLGPVPIVDTANVKQAAAHKSERKFYWWSIILVLILIERWYSRKLAGV